MTVATRIRRTKLQEPCPLPECGGIGACTKSRSLDGAPLKRWFTCQGCGHRWVRRYDDGQAALKRRRQPAEELAEERVRQCFALWESTGNIGEVQKRLGCWSRQMVHQVLHGQAHRRLAPDLPRLRTGDASRRCQECQMWKAERDASLWDDGAPGGCSLGIPECGEDPNWARLCPVFQLLTTAS